MTKIKLRGEDEWYPVYSFAAEGFLGYARSLDEAYGTEVDVPASTVKKWIRAFELFDETQEELAKLTKTVEGE